MALGPLGSDDDAAVVWGCCVAQRSAGGGAVCADSSWSDMDFHGSTNPDKIPQQKQRRRQCNLAELACLNIETQAHTTNTLTSSTRHLQSTVTTLICARDPIAKEPFDLMPI